jgi:hypothetical protein
MINGVDEEARRYWLKCLKNLSTPEEVTKGLDQPEEQMSGISAITAKTENCCDQLETDVAALNIQEFNRTLGIVEKLKGLSPASVRVIVNMGHIILEGKKREG